ncbi:MBL fold metallo-hydrolase [Dyella sp. 2RAB6]|uniref:MBL fold metallo-hydrolase n=1 Tax=Dyella sp. 2RAB6 TaxID=3232992 RepID=UPI003F93558C
MSISSTFARTALSAAILLGGTLALAPAHAAAPLAKTSAPGYYRMMLGDFEVTALSDGTHTLDSDQLLDQTKAATIQQALKAADQTHAYEWSFNGYLVNTGSKLVLIDTGAGAFMGSDLGKLVERIKAAGYTPEQIDEIYITHMHLDHVGGLVANGKAVFPNATVRAGKADADFWLSKAQEDKAPADAREAFDHAQTALNPYVKAGHFKPIAADAELVPGIRSVSLSGHTPGHTGYVVESKGQKLLVWGDTLHVQAVQFAHPDVSIKFDSDIGVAEKSRERILADVAKGGYLVAGAHIAFPGIGHVVADGKAYRWLPVSYAEIH